MRGTAFMGFHVPRDTVAWKVVASRARPRIHSKRRERSREVT